MAPLHQLRRKHQRDQRERVVVQRAIAALDLAGQRAVGADIANALANAQESGVDQVAVVRRSADGNQIEAGPVHQVVMQMVDRLGVAGGDRNAFEPRCNRIELRLVALADVAWHAQQHHGEIRSGPRPFVLALIAGNLAHQCIRIGPGSKLAQRARPITLVGGSVELRDEIAHRFYVTRVARGVVVKAGWIDRLDGCGNLTGAGRMHQAEACADGQRKSEQRSKVSTMHFNLRSGAAKDGRRGKTGAGGLARVDARTRKTAWFAVPLTGVTNGSDYEKEPHRAALLTSAATCPYCALSPPSCASRSSRSSRSSRGRVSMPVLYTYSYTSP